ncbi:hypothetical protein PN36_23235 [Candidatus Thiomargarita nelsonii]|uniref:DUF4124 domain-containing protein n=1 Tax=Candidatus Thiomargarita nelsonii TaxID=1003181 RepID=A0A0A6PEV8_9GAMM|nr:hypothetical protein PN36_23235 [Candidatus Thiomargarita nelsonii]
MKNIFTNKLTLFFIFCLIAQPLYAKRIRCWTNDEGVFQCANYVPQQYSQLGFTEYDGSGRKIKDIKAAPTSEEIAERERQEEQERRDKEQFNKDRAFLDIFSNEREIETARQAGLKAIDGQLRSLEAIIEGLKGNVKAMENSYERSQALNASKRQLRTIQRDIDSVKKRIEDTKDTLQKMLMERDDTNKEYDAYIQRYRDIKRRRRGR